MEGTRRLDRWDALLVFAILAAIFVALRLQKPEPQRHTLMPTFGSSGMDAVWRDSLRPMSPEDMRPRADPEIAWEDEAPAAEALPPQAVPAAEPRPAVQREYAPEPEAPVFERPKIKPLSHSLTESGYSNRTKAEYKPPQAQPPSTHSAPPPAPRAAAKPSSSSSNPATSSGRSWRRVAAP